jgi:hypothetical protein
MIRKPRPRKKESQTPVAQMQQIWLEEGGAGAKMWKKSHFLCSLVLNLPRINGQPIESDGVSGTRGGKEGCF